MRKILDGVTMARDIAREVVALAVEAIADWRPWWWNR